MQSEELIDKIELEKFIKNYTQIKNPVNKKEKRKNIQKVCLCSIFLSVSQTLFFQIYKE
jgi:hypothetical protein